MAQCRLLPRPTCNGGAGPQEHLVVRHLRDFGSARVHGWKIGEAEIGTLGEAPSLFSFRKKATRNSEEQDDL